MTDTKQVRWTRVSKRAPCVCCGKSDWCCVSPDGGAVCCMRIESDKPLHNGGFLHRLTEPLPRREAPAAVVERKREDLDALLTLWRARTLPGVLDAYAAALGVAPAALRALGAVWSASYGAWAFPMHDSDYRVIGIRLRANDGKKWAVTGSRNGLFSDGCPREIADTMLLCEGPTDTAALLTLGYDVIGRPSCSAGNDLVAAILERDRKHVVIMADADTPGVQGARKLSQDVMRHALSVKIVLPLRYKDAREWLRAGATRAVVDAVIRHARAEHA